MKSKYVCLKFALIYNRSLMDDGSECLETSDEFTKDKYNSEKFQKGFLKFSNDLKTKNLSKILKYIF